MTEISFKHPVLKITGRIDTVSSADVETTVDSVLTTTKFLVIDLLDCNYLSSTGIRVLVKTHKKLAAVHGRLIIAGMQPDVYQVIEMVGLHTIFNFEDTPEKAIEAIQLLESETSNALDFRYNNLSFQWIETEKTKKPLLFRNQPDMVGCNELGFAIGYGASAESDEVENLPLGLFVTTAVCAGFIPDDSSIPSDFRVAPDSSNIALFSLGALSFGDKPSGVVLSTEKELPMHELLAACNSLKPEKGISLAVIVNRDPGNYFMSVVFECQNDTDTTHFPPLFTQQVIRRTPTGQPIGLKFKLENVPQTVGISTLPKFIAEVLTIDNITDVAVLSASETLQQAIVWLFLPEGMENADKSGLHIETNGELTLQPYQRFLIRKLYNGLSRVVVEALHGGYSAQTYQVTSFDLNGRKLRPTVLKVANRAMITRESSRCQQYALPYIFNNSAAVLGTGFQGDKGALVYNFVGIGGEESRLKWLTHYFHHEKTERLEPLFDKIFLQILKPWYGQPIPTTLYPFKDHDPTLTFFPHIFETVARLFSIDADQQYIQIDELSRTALNPYWFLKHIYPARRQQGYSYFEGICHGDLNMQNILLDESMNVYLIDFSETKPRSVISDFARMEAIFLIDNAPLDNQENMDAYIQAVNEFYSTDSLTQTPVFNYTGRHREQVEKQVALTRKMRKYALDSVNGTPDILPYYMALLEWVLPVVCYSTMPLFQKRLSVCVSALLSEKVYNGIDS